MRTREEKGERVFVILNQEEFELEKNKVLFYCSNAHTIRLAKVVCVKLWFLFGGKLCWRGISCAAGRRSLVCEKFCFFVPPKEQRKMTRLSFIGLFLLIGKKHFSFLFWIVALTLKMPSQNDGGKKFLLFVAPFLHIHVRKKKKNDYWCTHTTYFQGEALYIYLSVFHFLSK